MVTLQAGLATGRDAVECVSLMRGKAVMLTVTYNYQAGHKDELSPPGGFIGLLDDILITISPRHLINYPEHHK